ncbi:response regulator [Vibrio splendidus]
MKILIVEDGEYKIDRVRSFIIEHYKSAHCKVSQSYSSAIKMLVENEFSLVILDMSLPTFDKTNGNDGGIFRTYGGLDIARQIKRRKLQCDFVFLTQHESFDDKKTIQDIHKQSIESYGDRYKGSIFYEHSGYEWKEKLDKVIKNYA